MRLVLYHFGSHVFERAAESVSLLICVRLYAPSKVANFNDIALFNEDVFRFDVPVNKSLLVHVINAGADLNEEVEGRVLAQVLLFANQVEQVAFACVLQRQEYRVFVLERSVQSTYVFVVQLFLNSYFSN